MNPARFREERGAVIPIVVLSLIAIFGMVVLTVDVGGTLTKRRSMVNASDSAALAAAQSFAMRVEAQCGTNEGPAQSVATTFATDNVSNASPNVADPGWWQTDCAAQTVAVEYTTNQKLFFAPVLGFGNTTPVTTTATAKWGTPGTGAAMPVELDPNTTNQCIYPGGVVGGTFNPPQVCAGGYWFDNQSLTNSGWGLMNLNQWGVDASASCDNSGGASDLNGWINQSNPDLVTLTSTDTDGDGKPGPTYVCTTDGGKTPNWMSALQSWAQVYQQWVAAGSPTNDPANPVPPTFLFPVNDPSKMIMGPPTSIQKYAITAFAPMQVVAVYDVGKDPTAAIGGSFSCTAQYTFPAKNAQLNLFSAALTSTGGSDCSHLPRNTISSLTLSPASGGGGNYSTPSDYTFDSTTGIITWNKNTAANVRLSFNYRSGGACPGHAPDPNAFCLQLAWGGPALIGEGPTTGYGPAMTVQLIK